MSWKDRLLKAAYTSPAGVRLPFQYRDMHREVTKKAGVFNFPNARESYVEDMGSSSRSYPMLVFFSGADYDLEASLFEEGLLQKGRGLLEHPIYGIKTVIPTGMIRRRDNLATGASVATLEVTFWESTDTAFPINRLDAASAVVRSISDFNSAQAIDLDSSVSFDSTSNKTRFRGTYNFLFQSTTALLQPIVNEQTDVQQRFDAISSSIVSSLGTLLDDLTTLSNQTTLLIQTPGYAKTDINKRVSAYTTLLDTLTGVLYETSNDYSLAKLFGDSYLTGLIVAITNTTFDSKKDAIGAADTLLQYFELLNTWRENNAQLFDSIDTGTTYDPLQSATAIATGYLVDISFTLAQEYVFYLDRPRSVVDLTAELYGEVDAKLDLLINSNNLSGSEILELPKGKPILYYR